MIEVPIDLSKLSRGDLEKMFRAENLSLELREEAAMLHELSDPEGPYTPVEGANQSEEWTMNVSPIVQSRVERILERE